MKLKKPDKEQVYLLRQEAELYPTAKQFIKAIGKINNLTDKQLKDIFNSTIKL